MDINREIEYVNSVYEGIENDKDVYDKYMDGLDKGIILDLGCGIGPVSNYLSKHGYLTIGYDIDSYHIEMGKRYKPHLDLQVGDITNIPKQEVKANGAVYAYCLQNLKDNEILKSFSLCNKNVVLNGKVLIFTTCKLDWTPSIFVNVLDENRLEKYLDMCGFRVDYVEYIDENIISVIAIKYKEV